MDYIQFSTLMATMLGGFGFVYKEMKTIEKDMKDESRTQSKRSDDLYHMFAQEIGVQAKRSDDLYRMFIDLVKEGRK